MKQLSNETTRYMMDTLTYGFVAGCAKNGQTLTTQEIDSLSRMLFTLYCNNENLIPSYYNICSKNDFIEEEYEDENVEEEYDDDMNNIDDYDDDYDNDDDIMGMFRMFEH